jgi:phage protein D
MELVDLAATYGNFYAPAFSVRLARNDLVRDLLLSVSRVEVDMVLSAASRFSFTVTDCYSSKLHAFRTGKGDELLKLLPFGAQVEICMGYGDAMSMPTAIVGMVTELTTSFPETGSPELIVSGYDLAFPMTLGKNSDSWHDRSDSDVAQLIASFHNLDASVDPTSERHPQIEQNQQSDWDFLKKLADRNSDDRSNHFEIYVDIVGPQKRPTLRFSRPRMTAAPVVRLVWGEGLVSFKPEANLAGQVSKVEVYGWDLKTKQAIVGRASAGDSGGVRGKSVGEYLSSVVRAASREPTLRLRQPVFTQAEADKRAKAALSEKTRKFVTGEAEAIGLPELRPDRTVQMDNLGAAFSKIYYIEQATHRVDSNGYRTQFKVRETQL